MPKNDIFLSIVFGFIGVGFTAWLFVVAYDRYYCIVCPFADTVIYMFFAIFLGIATIWLFTLPYCFTYRLIDDIACTDEKLKFNCGGKSFEEDDRVFLKFKLYSEESPKIPTHVFVLLRNGPWLCPYALWKDRIEDTKTRLG